MNITTDVTTTNHHDTTPLCLVDSAAENDGSIWSNENVVLDLSLLFQPTLIINNNHPFHLERQQPTSHPIDPKDWLVGGNWSQRDSDTAKKRPMEEVTFQPCSIQDCLSSFMGNPATTRRQLQEGGGFPEVLFYWFHFGLVPLSVQETLYGHR